LYDTILTTGEEVRCFWGRKVTGAAILFWLNKYMTMLYLVWNLGNLLDLPNNVCVVLSASLGGTQTNLAT
ncbi:hypothetical protein DICSQDRAFT_45519, partial [Dichomitus squalens LYAD-421 SS1]